MNLYDGECNFWTQNVICNFHTCSVCQCEENEIPLPWKQESEFENIDKKIEEKFYHWIEKYNYSSPDWLVETEIDSKRGVYVNLEKNPESFTGYQGQHIWNAIYSENCFLESSINQFCKEETILYKIISGLHSNINFHLSFNYLDFNKNLSYFNSSMIEERVLKHPDRITNLFFLYSMLIKAFYKAENSIRNYNYYTGYEKEDNMTKLLINEVYDIQKESILYEQFLQKEMIGNFNSETDSFDKFVNIDKLDQLKMKFRNISNIIDCVSCGKCKLHGKLQIYGLATMLKILFSKSDEIKFKRNELISFINLVGKVSKSLNYYHSIIRTNYLDNNNNNNITISAISYFIFSSIFLLLINLYFLKNKSYLDKKFNNRYDKIDKMLLANEKRINRLDNSMNELQQNEEFVVTSKKAI